MMDARPTTINPSDTPSTKATKLNAMLGYIYEKLAETKAAKNSDTESLQRQLTSLMQSVSELQGQVSSETTIINNGFLGAIQVLTRNIPSTINSTIDLGTYTGFPPLVAGVECDQAGYQCVQLYDLTGITNDTGGAWQKAIPIKNSSTTDTFILEVKRTATTYSLLLRLLK